METPKNTDTKSMALSGISAVGSLMNFYCAYAGPMLVGAMSPPSYYLNFVLFTFGAYGAGFLLAPAFLMGMNFSKSPDKYHIFLARMVGYIMCVMVYVIYSLSTAMAFKVAAITSGGVGLLGPTFAGLYLEAKQTPAEHMPAHIIFIVGGTLGFLATVTSF